MMKEAAEGIFVDSVFTKKMGVQELNLCFIPGEERSVLVD